MLHFKFRTYHIVLMNEVWMQRLLKSFIDFVFYSVIICDLSLQELPDDCTLELMIDIKHKVYKTREISVEMH